MLKNQREAAPSDAANSPAKFGSTSDLGASQKAIRLVPQGIAKQPTRVPSEATSLNEAQEVVVKKSGNTSAIASPKKSSPSRASQVVSPAPDGGPLHMSMLQTADEASGFDNSFVQEVGFSVRDFNEIDIMGKLDRDEKGNIILPVDEKTGGKPKRMYDQKGRLINQYGYLIDEQGNIVHNTTGVMVFPASDLDERSNIPMPFAIEKFNFNPFDFLGTFFYDDVEDPLSFNKS